MHPDVTSFVDDATNPITCILRDPEDAPCAIINSVQDFDCASGRSATALADRVIAFVRDQKLTIACLLQTHDHTDHLPAAPYLQQALNVHIGRDKTRAEFREMRQDRDAQLDTSRLMVPSSMVNMRTGQMRPGENNGKM